MTLNGWVQIFLYCAIIVALVKPLGWYMTRVFSGDRTFLSPILRPVERGLYALAGTSEREEQHWLVYASGMLLFNLAGFLCCSFSSVSRLPCRSTPPEWWPCRRISPSIRRRAS